MFLTLTQLILMFSDPFNLTPYQGQGVNQGLLPPENRFSENSGYVFEDVDYCFFAMFLTLVQLNQKLPPP